MVDVRKAAMEKALRDIIDATQSHVDGRNLFDELHLSDAHFVTITVRRNGTNHHYEGDWLKRLRDTINSGQNALEFSSGVWQRPKETTEP